jgi:L-threonylcarbamoyladenylate synthase
MAIVDLQQACKLLQKGEVVALPTETVYGLAGRIDQDSALKKIFQIKKRPFFDPLIVHVSGIAQVTHWAQIDPLSQALMERFWPGPLTLVLAKKSQLSSLINNGGETVAVRSPQHSEFQKVLQVLRVPLAAPSANLFGKTSPTQAQHVIDEFADQVPVLQGGACCGGIESTVIRVQPEDQVVEILRPGLIDQPQIERFLQTQTQHWSVQPQASKESPGHLANHYQPSAPMVLVEGGIDDPKSLLAGLQPLHPGPWSSMTLDSDPTVAARNFYGQLREFSQKRQPFWLPIEEIWQHDPTWAGLWDRMQKAASATLLRQDGKWRIETKA